MLLDISQKLAERTATFLMDDKTKITEAELNARLSLFPDSHINRIVLECRKIKGLAESVTAQ